VAQSTGRLDRNKPRSVFCVSSSLLHVSDKQNCYEFCSLAYCRLHTYKTLKSSHTPLYPVVTQTGVFSHSRLSILSLSHVLMSRNFTFRIFSVPPADCTNTSFIIYTTMCCFITLSSKFKVRGPKCRVKLQPDRSAITIAGLSDNLCYCWLVTPAVRWHRVTVSTKDKDHAGDEEFRGRRSIHLEQFTGRPANRNSLPIDVRSTFEGPPVRLIDSASEDHLWRALQIYSSSSSSHK